MKVLESEIFTAAFSDPPSLKWVEQERGTPKSFFGLEPDEELPTELFQDTKMGPRIPVNIRGSFKYVLQSSDKLPISLSFSRRYENTWPLSSKEILTVHFNENAAAYLIFVREPAIGSPERSYDIEVHSDFFGLTNKDSGSWQGQKVLTERGRKIIQDLTLNKERILQITGQIPEDAALLGQFLAQISRGLRLNSFCIY